VGLLVPGPRPIALTTDLLIPERSECPPDSRHAFSKEQRSLTALGNDKFMEGLDVTWNIHPLAESAGQSSVLRVLG